MSEACSTDSTNHNNKKALSSLYKQTHSIPPTNSDSSNSNDSTKQMKSKPNQINAHGVYFKMRASQPYISFFAIHPLIPHSLVSVFQITNPSVGVKQGASPSLLKKHSAELK